MESEQNPITLCESFQFYSSLLLTIIWKAFVKIACLVKMDFTYHFFIIIFFFLGVIL